METHYTLRSRLSLKNGILHEEIVRVPLARDRRPWWQQALYGLVAIWLLCSTGWFNDVEEALWVVALILWFGPLFACFVVLYGIFGDCGPSRTRR